MSVSECAYICVCGVFVSVCICVFVCVFCVCLFCVCIRVHVYSVCVCVCVCVCARMHAVHMQFMWTACGKPMPMAWNVVYLILSTKWNGMKMVPRPCPLGIFSCHLLALLGLLLTWQHSPCSMFSVS